MAEVGQQRPEGYASREALKRLLRAGIALVTLVVVGTIGYMEIENWNFSDSLYMVYITMSTIGFTEVRELDNTGRLWTALVGIGGIGTFAYAAGSLIELAVEGTVSWILQEQAHEKRDRQAGEPTTSSAGTGGLGARSPRSLSPKTSHS